MLNGVLRSQHNERFGKLVCFLFDGYVTFGHPFEQCGLRFWRRAVDLIGEDHVGEDRSRLERKQTLLLIEYFETQNVRGQKVRSKLDALKRAIEAPRERVSKRGLPDSGHIFDQQVSAGQKSHQRQLYDLAFAANNRLDC